MNVRGYFKATRTGTYGFLAALPLFVLYESLVLFVNQGEVTQIRVGADVWIKQAIGFLGGSGIFVIGLVVILVGGAIMFVERDRDIPIRGTYLAGILGESLIYAVLVAFLVSGLVGALSGMIPGPGNGTMLVLSIGAGLYEELVFRVLLVGGLFIGLNKLLPNNVQAYFLAAVIGALIFSAVHYVGPYGDAFAVSSFAFRFLFGLALNAIFLLRGFGVAAWTHSLYDVLVVTQLLG